MVTDFGYIGFTYYVPSWLHWLWRRIFCKRKWHLWAEVWSPDVHYFVCDACGREIDIRTIRASQED